MMRKIIVISAMVFGILVPNMAMASVSTVASIVEADFPTVEADGKDAAHVRVKLLSEKGVAMPNHEIELISSRKEDMVRVIGETKTDPSGETYFLVSAKEPGASTLIAYDRTEGVTLDARARVTFVENIETFFGEGGDSIAYAAEASLPAEKFTFTDMPETVKKGTAISLAIEARDANDITAKNYTGTVHFSAPGSEGIYVTLPEDYTFTDADLGAHTFSLAFSFQKEGAYKIEARDLKNPDLFGSAIVTVSETGAAASNSSSGALTMTAPKEGTYSTNIHTIAGTATPGIIVKIFDHEQEIGTVTVDADGNFTFTTSALTDGAHAFTAKMADSFGELSDPSNTRAIIIDTSAPKIEALELIPSGAVKPLTEVNVKLLAESKLTVVSLTVNNISSLLTEDKENKGVYLGKFLAPKEIGSYTIDIEMADELGNKQKFIAVKTLEVTLSGATGPTALDVTPPSQVTGVESFPDLGRVTLVWDNAKDDTGITKYRIYYGTSSDKLTNIQDTADDSTTWYIANLQNGVTYFFGLTAIDHVGNESSAGSAVVSATPGTKGKIETLHPAAAPKVMGETGPDVWMFLLLTMLGTAGYACYKRAI